MVALGLPCRAQAFSSCGEQGQLFSVQRLLTVVASLVAGHGLWGVGSVVVAKASVALQHAESSQTSDGTLVLCTGT